MEKEKFDYASPAMLAGGFMATPLFNRAIYNAVAAHNAAKRNSPNLFNVLEKSNSMECEYCGNPKKADACHGCGSRKFK